MAVEDNTRMTFITEKDKQKLRDAASRDVVRIPGHADQDSEVMPISVPTDVDQENDRVVMGV